jgi:hypothetical protein
LVWLIPSTLSALTALTTSKSAAKTQISCMLNFLYELPGQPKNKTQWHYDLTPTSSKKVQKLEKLSLSEAAK